MIYDAKTFRRITRAVRNRLLKRTRPARALIALVVGEKAQLTLETHLQTLAELRDKALAKENFGAAVTAEVSRGKPAGLYVERTDIKDLNGPRILEVVHRYDEASPSHATSSRLPRGGSAAAIR